MDAGEERAVYGGAPRLIVRDEEAAKSAARGEGAVIPGLTVSIKLPAPTATPGHGAQRGGLAARLGRWPCAINMSC